MAAGAAVVHGGGSRADAVSAAQEATRDAGGSVSAQAHAGEAAESEVFRQSSLFSRFSWDHNLLIGLVCAE